MKCFLRDSRWKGKVQPCWSQWSGMRVEMSKRLELLWELWDLPVSQFRWEQFTGTAKDWHLVQLEELLNSAVSQQTWKIRKNRETWQIRGAQCHPALISCSKEEAVGVAGENHKYCSAYWFTLHWSPNTKWIWFILCKQQLFGKCSSFGFTRWL